MNIVTAKNGQQFKKYTINFSSLTEMVNQVKNGQYNVEEYKRASIRTGADQKEWCGTSSMEEYLQQFKIGWPEGLSTISKLVKEYKDLFTSYFPQQDYSKEAVFDVTGEGIDIDRAVKGEPEDMIRYVESNKIEAGTKFQRIIVNASASCFFSLETIFIRGALIVSLINALESYGYRVELIARAVLSDVWGEPWNRGNLTVIDTVIKQFDESPDMDKISLCFAHPSYLRRFIFAVLEQTTKEMIDKFGFYSAGGYAYPNEYKEGMLDTDLYFPRPMDNEKLPAQLEWFKKAIATHFGETTITE